MLVQWHCVMQSSNGKNRIEFDTELNRIIFFSANRLSLVQTLVLSPNNKICYQCKSQGDDSTLWKRCGLVL